VREAESFNRSRPRYKQFPKVLVICEDSKSGLKYLSDASFHFRVTVEIEVSHCGRTDPKGIVEEALRRQKKLDHVYCVIDRDNHPNFSQAIELAKASSKVSIVASYPCFEFWLLLHFGHCRKPYTAIGGNSAADLLIRDLCKQPGMGDYDKSDKCKIFESLLDRLDYAREVAPRILTQADNDGEYNPSTQLHLLLNEFEKLSKPQPLA
jgi:hypothetical protein